MDATLAVSATAFWMGLLSSVSPCPLAANIAAMSYVGLLKLADEIADARGRRAGAAADAARVQALLLGSTPV